MRSILNLKSGDKFTRLTAIKNIGRDKNRSIRWLFKCECGKQCRMIAQNVVRGLTRSCGCLRQDVQSWKMIGKTYKGILVLKYVKKPSIQNRRFYLCRCVCGKKFIINSFQIRKGISCGCKSRIPSKISSYKTIWRLTKNQASKRNLKWDLNLKQFINKVTKPCYYCNTPAKFKNDVKYIKTAVRAHGLDRKNNKIGYTIYNSVSCCFQCNTMKLDYSYREFLNKIKKIYYNLVEKG